MLNLFLVSLTLRLLEMSFMVNYIPCNKHMFCLEVANVSCTRMLKTIYGYWVSNFLREAQDALFSLISSLA